MNRAIPIVCLVGLIFAMGALAEDLPVGAESAAPAAIEPETTSAETSASTPSLAADYELEKPLAPANEPETPLAATNEKIVDAVRAALDKDSEKLLDLADKHKFDIRYGTDIQRQYHPAIDHMIRSIEYTRRQIITEALENSKESATLKQDVIDAHHKAYAAVDMKLMELTKALAVIKDQRHEANAIESLLKMGIKQAKSL